MEAIFLGTGTSQGVPIIGCKCRICQSTDKKDKRLRSSMMVRVNETTIIIDSGPDFRYQMLREGIDNIDAIIYTHEHRDHIAGMDDIRAFNYIMKKTVDIYAEERVMNALKFEFDYVFKEIKYPGIPDVKLNIIDESEFYINEVKIIPIRGYHYNIPILAYRINDLTYITDFNFISEEEKKKIKGTKHLVINALRKEKHISHFTLGEALELIKEISPEKAYITHVGHQMGLYEEIQKELPENVTIAFDGLKLTI